MDKQVYIHYGSTHFDISRFDTPKNRQYFQKPYGGLWASPIDAKRGWKEWCEDERFRVCNRENSFDFERIRCVRGVRMDTNELTKSCGQCIYCENIDLLRGFVLCSKTKGGTLRYDCNVCSDFSEGRNEKKEQCVRLDRYIANLTDDEKKQIYKQMGDYLKSGIIPARNTVLWGFVESEHRRTCG